MKVRVRQIIDVDIILMMDLSIVGARESVMWCVCECEGKHDIFDFRRTDNDASYTQVTISESRRSLLSLFIVW